MEINHTTKSLVTKQQQENELNTLNTSSDIEPLLHYGSKFGNALHSLAAVKPLYDRRLLPCNIVILTATTVSISTPVR